MTVKNGDCRVPLEQECVHAEESARRAVKMVFSILGVNVDEPKEVEEFRENLRFGASMRRAADRGWLALVGMLAVGIGAAVWAGVVHFIAGHK
jgi:hypothetical protein